MAHRIKGTDMADKPAQKLGAEDRVSALPVLQMAGWGMVADRDAITKTYRFKNFIEAWRWMSASALWAEKMDHHPEWSNTYGEVVVVLTTHSAKGLTELDLKLARRMDQLARG